MITDEQVEQLRELGYDAAIAYHVREDPDDTASPVTKPVWAFAAPDGTTHYLAEEDQAVALIEQGAAPEPEPVPEPPAVAADEEPPADA
jgi:hypothetical protein